MTLRYVTLRCVALHSLPYVSYFTFHSSRYIALRYSMLRFVTFRFVLAGPFTYAYAHLNATATQTQSLVRSCVGFVYMFVCLVLSLHFLVCFVSSCLFACLLVCFVCLRLLCLFGCLVVLFVCLRLLCLFVFMLFLFALFCLLRFVSGEASVGMQGGAIASAEAEARGLKEVGLAKITCPFFV